MSIVVVFFLPILAIALSASALSKANAVERQTRSLQARLRLLQDRLEVPRERVSSPPAAAREREPARSEQPAPAGSVAEEVSAPAPVMPVERPQAAMKRLDWEELTGGRLSAWIGGLALFLGILFFVKYSIDQGLLSPAVRVAGSAILGTACIAAGLRLYRTSYRVIAHTLCAAGPAILYVVIYASYDFYGFIPVTAAFPLMVVVTLVTFLLAVRLDSRYIAVLGLLGGFITPPSLSTGVDRPLTLFGYLAFLDVGLVLVALRKRWSFLVPLAAAATALTQIGWTARFFTIEKVVTALGVQLLFSALFAGAAAAAHRMGVRNGQILAAGAGMPLLSLCMVTWMISFPELGQHQGLLFSVALLLVVLILGIVRFLRVGAMAMAGLISVVHLEVVWHFTGFDPSALRSTAPWYFVFLLIFAVFPFVFFRKLDRSPDLLPWIASALSGPIHFFLIFDALPVSQGEVLAGVLTLAFGAFYLAGLLRLVRTVPREHPRRSTMLALFAAVVLFFVSLAFPVVFDKEWLTVGWALEGLALVWLFGRIPHPALKQWAFVLLGFAFVRLALNPAVLEYHPRTVTSFLNWYLYGYGTVIACLLVAAVRWRPPGEVLATLPVAAALRAMAAILAFLLVNIEIADFYSQGRHLTFQFGTSLGRDMTYSLAWAAYGLVLLLIGITVSSRGARFAALGLLAVTILKLFLYDLWWLGELYRVGAFVGLAMILILVSFLYQRHFARAAEPSDPGAGKG